jgi:hypothetical protein
MKTFSISQIQRELHHLHDFDILEIVDKKKDSVKGYFLDIRYKAIVEKLVEEQRKKEFSSLVGLWEDRDVDLKTLREHAWKK